MKFYKRAVALVTAAIIAVLPLCFAETSANEAAVSAMATQPVKDADGYYQVYTADELYWISQKFNEQETSKMLVRIMDDIVVNDGVMTASSTGAREWVPIGCDGISKSINFKGEIDGQGHYISGLYCPNASTAALVSINYGTIKNLGIINSYFNASVLSNQYSDAYAGAFAGLCKSGSVIQNCYSVDCTIETEGGQAGGICAKPSDGSTIANCFTMDNISSGQTGLSGRSKWADAIGAKPAASSLVENTYYDDSKTTSYTTATSCTNEQFYSGELTYLLNRGQTSPSNAVWRQNITCGDRDFLPVLDTEHYIVYYENGGYTNHEDDIQSSDDPESLVPNANGVYELRTADQLFAFAKLVNDYPNNKGLSAILKDDIVFNYEAIKEQNPGVRPWIPIGSQQAPYVGKFSAMLEHVM